MYILDEWYFGKIIGELLREETPTSEGTEKSTSSEYGSHTAMRDNPHHTDEYGVRKGTYVGKGRKKFVESRLS